MGEMTNQATTFDEAVSIISGLSPLDRVRLLERLASMLENDLSVSAGTNAFEESPPAKTSFAELAAWLESHPAEEPWGDLNDDEDAADYVHRMRRQTAIQLDDPGDAA
jgi:hypothetical protein